MAAPIKISELRNKIISREIVSRHISRINNGLKNNASDYKTEYEYQLGGLPDEMIDVIVKLYEIEGYKVDLIDDKYKKYKIT